MRNTLRTNDDLLAQLQSSHSLNNQIQKQKSELLGELQSAADYILDLENKFYASRIECLDKLKQLKEKEACG